MARPIEYTQEYTEKAKEYLKSCEDSEINIGTDERPTLRVNVNLPSIEGLALHLDIARSTIYEWKNKYDEFSDILERILAKQAKNLLDNGLAGKYNPTITKVMLTKHGYREGLEQTGADGAPLTISVTSYKDAESGNTI